MVCASQMQEPVLHSVTAYKYKKPLFSRRRQIFPPCRRSRAVLRGRPHNHRSQTVVPKNHSASELPAINSVASIPVVPSMSAEDLPNQPNVLRNAIPMDVLRGHERLIALPPVESVLCVSPVSFRYDRAFSNVMGVVRGSPCHTPAATHVYLGEAGEKQAAQCADTCAKTMPSLKHCIMVSCQEVQ